MSPDMLIFSIAALISGTVAIVLLYLAFRPRKRQGPVARTQIEPQPRNEAHVDEPAVPFSPDASTESPAVPTPGADAPPAENEEEDEGWQNLLVKLENFKTEFPESGISSASAYRKDGQRISKSELKRLIKRIEEGSSPSEEPEGGTI